MNSRVAGRESSRTFDRRMGLALTLLILVLLAGYSVWGTSKRAEEAAQYWDGLFASTPTFLEQYPAALKAAQRWRPDAMLYDFSLNFYPPDWQQPPELNFAFRSDSSLLDVFLVWSIERRLYTKPVTLPSMEVGELHPSEQWLDSSDALEIAQGAGGALFLRNHASAQVRVALFHTGKDRGPYYVVRYGGPGLTGSFRVEVDVSTGEILFQGEEQPASH